MPDLTGQSVGRYHLVEKLGQGGMAIVYKAYDTRLDREVAIKFIRMDLVGEAYTSDVLRRFEREAKALARVSHPNIVHVYDYGEYNGTPYLVMEYLGGGTLKGKLIGKPIPYQEAARLLALVAHALAFAHENAIIHRDIKPANILLTMKGQPMLSDFGIAKILDTTEAATLTGTGTGIGTPEYMSPEQGQGKKDIDHRTDIYALGIVFYEMITGRRPFQADTPVAVVIKHLTEPLPRPRLYVPDLPESVEYIIFRALAKAPEDRYQEMALFAQDLEKIVLDSYSVPTAVMPSAQPQSPVVQPSPDTDATSTRTQVNPISQAGGGAVPVEVHEQTQSTVIQPSSVPLKTPAVEPSTLTSPVPSPIPPVEPSVPAVEPHVPIGKLSIKPVSRRGFIIGGAIAGVAAVAVCGGLAVVGIQQLNKSKSGSIPSQTAQETQIDTKTSLVEETQVASQTPVVNTATAKPTAVPTAVPTEAEVWPRGNLPRNKTFIRGGGNGTVGMANPMMVGFNHQNGFSLLTEPCAFYGVHADKTYMWLAESYKLNDNATEITITFRKGITWSDKTPFSANDIAFGINKLKTVDGLNRAGNIKNEVDSVEVIDDNNLKVKLKWSDWRFFFKVFTYRCDLGDYSIVVPEHIFKDIPDANLKSFNFFDIAKGYPVTTAPYTLYRSEETVNQFDLLPEWWAVKTGLVARMPDVKRVLCIPYTSDTLAAQQIINNEIDVCMDIRPLIMSSILNQTNHVTTWTGKEIPYGYVDWWPISVYFCNQKPPWDNPKLHWAVAYAIDQQQVIDVAWGGAGLVNNSPFPAYPKLVKYMESIKDLSDKYNVLEYNLDKSKALMTEAGFTLNKDGFWADKKGVQLDANLYAGVPTFSDLAPVICEQLRKAGFASEHKAPQDVWAAKVDGRASLFLFGHGGGIIDPCDTLNLYAKPSNNVPLGQQNWGNIARWSPVNAEAIRVEMNNTAMDDPKMYDLFRKWMAIYYEQLPDCPICQWYHRIPSNQTYWTNWPDASNPYMQTAPWHLTQLMVITNLKATGK